MALPLPVGAAVNTAKLALINAGWAAVGGGAMADRAIHTHQEDEGSGGFDTVTDRIS